MISYKLYAAKWFDRLNEIRIWRDCCLPRVIVVLMSIQCLFRPPDPMTHPPREKIGGSIPPQDDDKGFPEGHSELEMFVITAHREKN